MAGASLDDCGGYATSALTMLRAAYASIHLIEKWADNFQAALVELVGTEHDLQMQGHELSTRARFILRQLTDVTADLQHLMEHMGEMK